MHLRPAAFLVVSLATAVSSSAVSAARDLTYGDRVAAQRVIEEVYWRHRLWPKENPGPKPPLAAVMSEADLRIKVDDYLADSNALDLGRHRPITGAQLQAELDRMARDSRDPQLLGELFAALGNDPLVIAETLVRPLLAARLIRDGKEHDASQRSSQLRSLDGASASSFRVPALALSCTNNTWKPMQMGPPDKRSRHTAIWTGTEMIVWGGAVQGGSGIPVATGGRYNPATDTWAPTSTDYAPSARTKHTAVWTGTEMIVWGGETAYGYATTQAYRYNPVTNSWVVDGTNNPLQYRRNHTAVWTGTEMIVWGGDYQVNNTDFPLKSGGRYNPSGDFFTSWTPTSTGSGVPEQRLFHTAIWTGSRMIVWGGSNGSTVLDSGGQYDPATDTWSPVSPSGLGARRNHSAVWTGTQMLVWGGLDVSYFTNTGMRYDPSSDSWNPIATTANTPSPRDGHAALWTGSTMLIWGGLVGSGGSNSGGRYDPATDTWMTVSSGANSPGSRIDFSAVWTGNEMIVWGGNVQGLYQRTGSRYSPASDSWTPTSLGDGVPLERSSNSVVWTGAEMIVWGGYDESAGPYVNTGGRYDPATDSWHATSLGAGVPSARSGHHAVWTGSEMIVWGGSDAGSYRNDGARYDPAANKWTAMASGTARSSGSAVWTGTQMIVWGGFTSAGLTNTGARYNPVSDSWTSTSTTLAPFMRFSHAAVWTGTEMIVWGGLGCTGNPFCTVGDGGRYNPAADSWVRTSSTNAPVGRTGHSAVWTGTQMIVWGGTWVQPPGTVHILNTGASYSPGTDTWTATSTSGSLPLERYGHSAVWDGTQMIVWGGYSGSFGLGDGGRYIPSTGTWTAIAFGPSARYYHAAVVTGSQMIVWGGTPLTTSGGVYCDCPNAPTVFRDFDGDGYGDPAVSLQAACDGTSPAGYVLDGTDCDDANPSVHPSAAEINDGIDNQCPGDAGFGVVDEVSGESGFFTAGDTTRFSWTAQTGAASYDVRRSTTADFTDGCVSFSTADPYVFDATTPSAGSVFYYLVRASAPNVGSWGRRHDGTPRMGGCLSP